MRRVRSTGKKERTEGEKMTEQKMRGMEFCGWCVRAFLAGAKTQTRRVMKPQPMSLEEALHSVARTHQIGTAIYAKEALIREGITSLTMYEADHEFSEPVLWRWKRNKLPARYMPKEAARIFRRITRVWPERLQDISEADAIAEGAMHALPDYSLGESPDGDPSIYSAVRTYGFLWEELNGKKHPWASTWVWCYEFEEVEHGIEVETR